MDARLASAFVARCHEEAWAVHVKVGIPHLSANGNHVVHVSMEYASGFPFDEKLAEVVNQFVTCTP